MFHSKSYILIESMDCSHWFSIFGDVTYSFYEVSESHLQLTMLAQVKFRSMYDNRRFIVVFRLRRHSLTTSNFLTVNDETISHTLKMIFQSIMGLNK